MTSIFVQTPQQRIYLRLLVLIVGLFLLLSLGTMPALAAPVANKPSLNVQVQVGFGTDFQHYRSEGWTPAQVTLKNTGSNFSGKLSVSAYSGNTRTGKVNQVSPWRFEQAISIDTGLTRTYSFVAPLSMGNFIPTGFLATVLDVRGQQVASGQSDTGYDIPQAEILMGWLSDTSPEQEPLVTTLRRITLPNHRGSLTPVGLTAATFPSQTGVLENFDVIVLDNFETRTLQSQQLLALQNWLNRGGALIVIGGKDWQRTLTPLPPALLPVVPSGTRTLSGGTSLLPVLGTEQTNASSEDSVVASTATLRTNDPLSNTVTLLQNDTTPLIVRSQQGQGAICYVAFDLADPALQKWTGLVSFWQSLLVNLLGERFLISRTAQNYPSGPGQLLTHGSVLTITEVAVPFNFWIIGLLLLSYLIIIGPVRHVLIRRYNLPRGWGWRIFLGSALVFSLLAYTIAGIQKQSAAVNNSVSLLRLAAGNGSNTALHATSYMGIFTPNQGNLAISTPGNNLIAPVSETSLARSSLAFRLPDTATTINTQSGDTNMQLANLSAWTYHPVIQEQDRRLAGGLVTHLVLHDMTLEGTITNKLGTALNDVYILLPHYFAHIQRIEAGQTQTVRMALDGAPKTEPLADAITRQSGLKVPYFPYASNGQPENDTQRHVALLAALSGASFTFQPCEGSCASNAMTSTTRAALYLTGGQVPHGSIYNDYDPLLISGASATLIAWADQPLGDTVSINGLQPGGRQENFIQAPLSIDFSQSKQIPSGLLTSQVVDIQSYTAQVARAGLYSLSVGSVTFETQIPAGLSVQRLLITQPDLAVQPDAQGNVPSGASSVLRASLYNWQRNVWEPVTFDQKADNSALITQPEAYIGPSGRVLIQIASQNSANIYFSKPLLAVNISH